MSFFSKIGDVVKGVGSFLNPISPLIGAGASILGSVIGADSQEKTNETNVDLTRENMAWQERMANSAHQRAVTDLRSAGLNPILSVNRGADTPSVQSARIENPGVSYAQAGNSALANALNVQTTKQNIATSKSSELVNSASAVKLGAEAQRQMLENDLIESRIPLEKWKLQERQKSKGWELLLDDLRRGKDAFNPFSDIFGK